MRGSSAEDAWTLVSHSFRDLKAPLCNGAVTRLLVQIHADLGKRRVENHMTKPIDLVWLHAGRICRVVIRTYLPDIQPRDRLASGPIVCGEHPGAGCGVCEDGD
jgi:hypothetical protein